jgi:hypothetical protein
MFPDCKDFLNNFIICRDEEMVIDRNCYLKLLSPYNKIPRFAATLFVLIIPIH